MSSVNRIRNFKGNSKVFRTPEEEQNDQKGQEEISSEKIKKKDERPLSNRCQTHNDKNYIMDGQYLKYM
tara:strand:+ start:1164 stop:1370 length:207 start_codon:yes stop_codon:yes gene_type:complete